ncbi:MAG TPA: HAMP domain-containing sensor histidine kinase [Streptosporangiaceae bacterium]
MEQLIRSHRSTELLDNPPAADGDTSAFPRDGIRTSPGDDSTGRFTRSAHGLGSLGKQRRFVFDASHELRNPLAGLRIRLEEARQHPDQTALDDLIEHALHDIHRLEAIVTDMLLLSRAEANGNGNGNGSGARNYEALDLAEMVASEISHRPNRLAVERILHPGVTVMGVRGELARVLANLLDNAQRHLKRKVTVEVRRRGDNAELVVSDDGDGIAAADRERIFQRFVRLAASRERDRGGTGLGLAISREIAHAHHGTLDAGESALGGARFVLRLPLTQTPCPAGSA